MRRTARLSIAWGWASGDASVPTTEFGIRLVGKRMKRMSNGMKQFLRIAMWPTMFVCSVMVLSTALIGRADEPYARSKDYDLQHSKVVLRFDLEQKKVIGSVTHTVSPVRQGVDKITFDSVGLQ